MSGLGGVQPNGFSVPLPTNSAGAFSPGQQFTATVQGERGAGLFVRVAGVTVPLGGDVVAELGDTVTVEVLPRTTTDAIRVRIQVRQSATAGSNAAPARAGQPQTAPATARESALGTPGSPTRGQAQTPASPARPGTTPATQPNAGQAAAQASAAGRGTAPSPTPGSTPAATANATPATPPSTTPGPSAPTVPANGAAAPSPLGTPNAGPVISAAAAPTSEALGRAVAAALQALGALDGATAEALQALPGAMPAIDRAVLQVLSLLLTNGSTGADLQLIEAALSEAAAQGAIPQSLADDVRALVAQLVLREPAGLADVLRQWGGPGSASLEARLALALVSGDADGLMRELGQDLQTVLARVGGDEKIAQFLRSVGQFRGFEQAVSRVLDRLAGVRLTNLRSLDQAYHLMEIPVDPQTGFERIQVHFWGDPGQKQKGFDAQNATVAIDVSMTALGDLWIVLAVGEAGRRCTIRAAEEAARNALASGRDDLCAALAKAGYGGADVRVTEWDRDRLREIAAMTQRTTGINVEA